MKKIALILVAMGLAFTSCDNTIDITRKISAEDAAIVPYQNGQTIKFLNTLTNDTLELTVTDDHIQKMNSYEHYYGQYDSYNSYSYCRYISMSDEFNLNKIEFIICPDKEFYFVFNDYGKKTTIGIDFDLNEIEPLATTTIEGKDYTNVYTKNLSEGGKAFFSTEKGLIMLRTVNYSYLLIE